MRFEHWLYVLPLRWRSLVGRRAVDRELDDEIEYHLQQEVDDLASGGMDRAEARQIVERRFGGLALAKERCRDARGTTWLDALGQDLRFGARMLRRSPVFTLVAVLTLALGIGANTAVYSLVDGILLAPLPYPDPSRLVSITGTYPNGGLAEMRQTSRTLDVAAYAEGHWLTRTGDGDPVRLSATLVSAELMTVLDVRPALGRRLRPGEDVAGHDRYVILSDGIWQSRFGRDPHVVGRFIELDGVAREVIGVMPASFHFPSARTQVWVPLGLDARDASRYWGGDYMPVVGRLRPGVTILQAREEVRLLQARIGAHFPWPMPASWNRDVSVVPLAEWLVGEVRTRLILLMAAVVLVLVIVCANVANLSLSRAVARQREMGIRAAIGAGPRRIARQLLTESVLLAAIGAAAGLLVALQTLAALKMVLPPETPRLAEAHLNWRVLAFTGALAVAAGCAVGVAPVVQVGRLRLRAALDGGGRDGRRALAWPVRAGLTVAQVACAVLLVIAAGLLVRSLWLLTHIDPGFRADEVVTAVMSPAGATCASPERCLSFYRDFEERLRGEAGVRSAALVNTLPLTGAVAKRSIELEGLPAETPLFWLQAITPDYFRVMDIRVETGRGFTRADLSDAAAVAILPSSTAKRFWPGRSPLGRHIRFAGEPRWHTVVGVVADVRGFDLTRTVPTWMSGVVYVPHGPHSTMEDGRIPVDMTLTVRTSMTEGDVAAMLRRVARSVNGQVAISDVKPMAAVVADAVAAPAATTSLLVTMAGLALVLGCLGVYGVLSFLVSRQTHELGIRLALGAQRADVFWLVIKEGAALCAAGVALGILGAALIARWLASELYGVSPTDPATYGAVAIAVSLVTMIACYVPTRRAMGVDPLIVLREP